MSSTSTNFSLILATGPDKVDVDSHVANNFRTIDSLLAVAHTGTGQLKAGLSITNPTLVNFVVTGTMTGGTIVATTGNFQTITATGGALTVNSLTIGTYALPATIGITNQVLGVVTGHAVWIWNSGGTGADVALDNLSNVAINTNLNNFSAGNVVFSKVTATSGTLSGMTAVSATTGTFSSITVTSATLASLVGVTGGTATFSVLGIGTYKMPAAIGTTNQVLTVTTGQPQWIAPQTGTQHVSLTTVHTWANTSTSAALALADSKHYRLAYTIQVSTGQDSDGIYALFGGNAGGVYFNGATAVVNKLLVDTSLGLGRGGYLDGFMDFTTHVRESTGTHSAVGVINSIAFSSGAHRVGVAPNVFVYETTASVTNIAFIDAGGVKMTGTAYLYTLETTV